MDAIYALPPASLRTGGTVAAFQDRLDKAETLIVAGRTGDAVKELKSLRKRVDGCNGTSRERVDPDDWIGDCADQHAIRSLIDEVRVPARGDGWHARRRPSPRRGRPSLPPAAPRT